MLTFSRYKLYSILLLNNADLLVSGITGYTTTSATDTSADNTYELRIIFDQNCASTGAQTFTFSMFGVSINIGTFTLALGTYIYTYRFVIRIVGAKGETYGIYALVQRQYVASIFMDMLKVLHLH